MLNTKTIYFCLLFGLLFNKILLADDELPKNWPWKGMTYSVELLNDNLKILLDLKEQGGNFIRIHINLAKDVRDTGEKPKVLLQGYYTTIDRALDILKENDITAVISLSFFPKIDNPHCKNQKSLEFWNDFDCKQNMVDMVKETMLHFKNRGDELSGFDFISEPASSIYKRKILPPNWMKTLSKIVDMRNEIVPNKFIIASVSGTGFPEGFGSAQPLNNKAKIIYNLHMYQPMKYTHQGIDKNSIGKEYPGYIKFTKWNSNKLYETLKPVRDFQRKNNALILVGEFGAVLWAKNREAYLQDLINIFNQYRWGWSYFGNVTYKGWNPNYQAEKKHDFKFFGKESETWEFLKRNYIKLK